MSLTASASEHLIYLGTYTRSTSEGIYAVRLDARTGALGQPVPVARTANPSFLALSPDGSHLYAVSESSTMAVPFAIDPGTGGLAPLQSQDAGGKAPCHLVVDRTERTLVLAHYHSGIVAALPIRADGTLGTPATVIQHAGRSVHPTRQEAPHVHSVTLSPDNRFVIVCDLGLDRVFTYALDPATAQLTPAAIPFVATAPGAGPRHAAFSADGRHVLVINELDSTLVSYRYDAVSGALTPADRQSTLPAGWTGESTTAEVRVHPNGRFVYGSNRGHDSIAIFAFDAATGKLTPRGHMPTGGKNPRNFALSPDGAWLVAANQNSDNLRVFRVDPATGSLTPVPGEAAVPMPVCVLFAR
ncbi:MAG: lactonase family protein [Opitutaceae bacterium]|nr:lactonase family protein [Opitutaceae bacterium]